jgi:hypothetical protein
MALLAASTLIQPVLAAPPAPSNLPTDEIRTGGGGAADMLGYRAGPPDAGRDPNYIGIHCTDSYGTVLSERDRGYRECLDDLKKKRKQAGAAKK